MPGHLVQSMLVPIVLTRGQQNDVILNFDDDDLYADKYVEYMVTQMQRRNLVAVTLSGWHNFFEAQGSAGYSEPKLWDPEDEDEMDEILYGYCFSYVHLRVMAVFYPYPNLEFAEDGRRSCRTRGRCGGPLPPHRPFDQQYPRSRDLA